MHIPKSKRCSTSLFDHAFMVSEAGGKVIVHQSCGLEVCIDDRGTKELKPLRFKLFADPVRQGSIRRHLPQISKTVHNRSSIYKVPKIIAERTVLFLYAEKASGVIDG
jgi:hypothetical protein